MSQTVDSPSDNPPITAQRNSAKGSRYAKRIPQGVGRYCQHIRFDAQTSEQLELAQRLEQLRGADNSRPSYTRIIRRAVHLYSGQLLKDAQAGVDLSGEVSAMLE